MASELEELMALLRHPARRLMWKRMLTEDEPRSAKDFAEELRASVSRLAYHLHQLRDGGAIELVDEIPIRGATKKMYAPTEKFDRRRVLGMIAEMDGGEES